MPDLAAHVARLRDARDLLQQDPPRAGWGDVDEHVVADHISLDALDLPEVNWPGPSTTSVPLTSTARTSPFVTAGGL